jgi:hypothetical protein
MEFSSIDLGGQVLMGGAHHPHINRDLLSAPDALNSFWSSRTRELEWY